MCHPIETKVVFSVIFLPCIWAWPGLEIEPLTLEGFLYIYIWVRYGSARSHRRKSGTLLLLQGTLCFVNHHSWSFLTHTLTSRGSKANCSRLRVSSHQRVLRFCLVTSTLGKVSGSRSLRGSCSMWGPSCLSKILQKQDCGSSCFYF